MLNPAAERTYQQHRTAYQLHSAAYYMTMAQKLGSLEWELWSGIMDACSREMDRLWRLYRQQGYLL